MKQVNVKQKWMRGITGMLAGLFMLAIPFSMTANAKEEASYVTTVYNEQNGLPTGEANAVLQTSDGYIWIGSYGGLIRYDGTEFVNFSQESDGIASSSIRSLFEDSQGRLWIGTNDSGVFVYEKNQFVKIQGSMDYSFRCIRDFAEGSDGKIYVASNSGLGEIQNGVLITYEDEKLKDQIVYSIAVDAYDRVWSVLNSGICEIVKDGQILEEIDSAELFQDKDIYCVASGQEGEIYLGTSGNELIRIEFASEEIINGAMKAHTYQTGQVTTHNRIQVKDDGTVLISGLRGFGWVTANGEFHELTEEEKAASVNAAEIDYEGNIWLASSGLGLVKYAEGAFSSPNITAGLEGVSVNAIEYLSGVWYVGTDTGLLAFDESWKPISNALVQELEGARVRHMMASKSGELYVGTYYDKGVVRYQPSTGKIDTYDSEKGLIGEGVRMMLELSDGSIAVGTQEGVSIIRNGRITESYGQEDGLGVTAVLCLAETQDGRLLAGSDGGGIYVIEDGNVSNYGYTSGLEEGVVLRMLPDEDGGVYVSAGSSLYYWQGEEIRRLENFRKGPGSIFDLYLRDNILWIMQNSGVLAVDCTQLLGEETIEPKVYGFEVGLGGSLNANTWNKTDKDGNLYIATRNGISIFRFREVENLLPVGVIQDVTVDGVIYRHPEEILLDENVDRVTIHFSALTYRSNSDINISCYLEGVDEQAHVFSEEKSERISYTNLPGGNYTFYVKVYDSTNPESVNEYQLQIHKEKKVTEQLWFWIACVLVVMLVTGVLVLCIVRLKIKRIRQRQEEYQEIVEQALRTFANTIDAKDVDTKGHSQRVAKYARELARRMGMSEKEQERIYYIALLHDIGKIGIPDEILKKQGMLTDEEWEIVKRHPVIGSEILKDFTAVEGIAEGARYHHERYDGEGYCEHKKGKEIPLAARIIGVADTYDAMATTRCYREALPRDVILEELQKGSGTQFDAEIIPFMLRMIEDGFMDSETEKELPL